MSQSLAGANQSKVAIKTKCLSCTNMNQTEITECRVSICPLWAYRPYQVKKGAKKAPIDVLKAAPTTEISV